MSGWPEHWTEETDRSGYLYPIARRRDGVSIRYDALAGRRQYSVVGQDGRVLRGPRGGVRLFGSEVTALQAADKALPMGEPS